MDCPDRKSFWSSVVGQQEPPKSELSTQPTSAYSIFGNGFDSPLSPGSPFVDTRTSVFGSASSIEEPVGEIPQRAHSALPIEMIRNGQRSVGSASSMTAFPFPPPLRSLSPQRIHPSSPLSYYESAVPYAPLAPRGVDALALCSPPNSPPYRQRPASSVARLQLVKECVYCKSIGVPTFIGHIKNDCPEFAKLRPCKICGASGKANHTATHCPKRRKIELNLKPTAGIREF